MPVLHPRHWVMAPHALSHRDCPVVGFQLSYRGTFFSFEINAAKCQLCQAASPTTCACKSLIADNDGHEKSGPGWNSFRTSTPRWPTEKVTASATFFTIPRLKPT